MNNRFLHFFEKASYFKLIVRSFFTLVGTTLIILFFLEFFAGMYMAKKETEGNDLAFNHHPYLDYIMKNKRETENVCVVKTKEGIKVDMYGGSTMVSPNVEFIETIPSHLAKILCDKGVNVEVRNRGQLGYNSSQEVIKFFLKIKEKDIPDIVIFYDGVNDMSSEIPGYPFMQQTKKMFYYLREDKKEKYFPNIINLIGELPINFKVERDSFSYNKQKISFFDYPEKKYDTQEDFYDDVINTYNQNVEVVKSLENIYDFTSFFYWQPEITTKNSLSEEERAIMKEVEWRKIFSIYPGFHEPISKLIDNNDNVIDLRYIFDDYEETIYIDDCHKKPEGNRIVAERMAEDILEYLKMKNKVKIDE